MTSPRLVNLRDGAQYLGVSFWTIRDYVLAGLIPFVQLPPARPREGERQKLSLRRVLIDRQDLDAFIDQRKSPQSVQAPSTAQSQANGRKNGATSARDSSSLRSNPINKSPGMWGLRRCAASAFQPRTSGSIGLRGGTTASSGAQLLGSSCRASGSGQPAAVGRKSSGRKP